MLLLAPLTKRETSRKEKPIIVIAEDNSQSLNHSTDSAYYHAEFQKNIEKLANNLAKDYEVHQYTFGAKVQNRDEVSQLFSEQKSDISQILTEVSERYYHRNIGALVIASDGIYNSGVNPLTPASSLPFPVYTVAMGDTTEYRDATISNVRFNRIAYLGNEFPVEVTVSGNKLKGKTTNLTIHCDGRKIHSKNLTFDNDHAVHTETITISADKEGLQSYTIEIGAIAGEKTLRNNRRTIAVEIIDGRQKVAIVSAVPHPDVAALKAAIESNQNFEVKTFLASDLSAGKNDFRNYSLLILHQLPTKVATANIDVAKMIKDVPTIFILGSQSDLSRLNALHAGVEVYSRIDRQNEVTAIINKDFTYFTIDKEMAQRIAAFPPLLSPFGEYKTSGNAQTLTTAKIGTVNSNLPLIVLTQQGSCRYSFITGEGLWRWRLADWQESNSHSNFDGLISKIALFTALKANKEHLNVEVKHLFGEGEPITLEAQLYNDNFELVNTPDIDLTITNAAGEKNKYSFNRTATGYSTNIGAQKPGKYNYSAETHYGGHNYTATGHFIVEEFDLEAQNSVANHSLLATMAASTGGEMVDARQTERIAELLRDRKDMQTVIYSETHYGDILNMPLVFVLIVVLLSIEWLTRKYLNGEP
ncbi:MAG: hypothetical protein J6X58_01300 [Bacteroidales bacterium]|nr:hypothetical protein [Bacteroidales bacterium]